LLKMNCFSTMTLQFFSLGKNLLYQNVKKYM
jgi:hypothetical protein